MAVVEVLVDRAGRPILAKRARTTAEVEHLRHEARMLHSARHPGVVEVIEFTESDDHAELTLRWAGSHTLATIGRVGAHRAAGLVIAAASTVADLHDVGLVHGRIEPEHVVLGPGGRPLLCGLAHADGRMDRSVDDVAGLGRLLVHLVGDDAEAEAIPTRRFRWTVRPDGERRALLNLADHATADDPTARPTARALADAVHAAIPNAQFGHADPPGPAPDPADGSDAVDRSHGRHWAWALALVVGVGLVLGLSRIRTSPIDGRATATSTTRSASTARPSTTTSPTSATTTVPATTSTTPPTTEGAPPTSIAPETDGMVEVGGVRYVVGRAGDLVLVGDWNCDGRPTAAVLRPTTDEVFLFDRWADLDRPITESPARRIPGAAKLHGADADGDGCVDVVVTYADGRTTRMAP